MGPGGKESGWHIPLINCKAFYKKIKSSWADIATCVKATVQILELEPDSIKRASSSRHFKAAKKSHFRIEKLS